MEALGFPLRPLAGSPVSEKTSSRSFGEVPKTNVFDTLSPPPPKPAVSAYKSVSKLIPKSKFQYLAYPVSFGTLFIATQLFMNSE